MKISRPLLGLAVCGLLQAGVPLAAEPVASPATARTVESPVQGSAGDALVLPYGVNYPLPETAEGRCAAFVPVRFGKEVRGSADLVLSIQYVERADGKPVDGLTDKFHGEIGDGTPGGAGPGLTLRTDVSLEQGAYRVHLLVSRSGASAPVVEPQAIDLLLQRPAGHLADPQLRLRQTRGCFWGESSLEGDTLVLEEDSGKTALRSLQIKDTSRAADADHPVTGRLTFADPVADPLGARGVLELHAGLDGVFPVGTSRGTLQISSPQLADPASFSYEVDCRWHWWTLCATILAGFGVGYLLRTALRDQLQRRVDERDANDILTELAAARLAHADGTFQTKVTDAQKDLIKALRARDATKLPAATQAASGALQAALQGLDQRRADLTSTLKLAVGLGAEKDRPLPPAFTAALGALDGSFQTVSDCLKDDAVDAAARTLETARATLATALADAGRICGVSAQGFLTQFAATRPAALPLQVSTVLHPGAEALKAAIAGLPPLDHNGDFSKIQANVSAADAVYFDAQLWTNELQSWLQTTVNGVLKILADAGSPAEQERADRLNKTAGCLVDLARAALSGSEDANPAWAGAVNDLADAWQRVILATVSDVRNTKDVQALLEGGDPLGAAARAVKPAAQEIDRVLGDASDREDAKTGPLFIEQVRVESPRTARPAVITMSTDSLPGIRSLGRTRASIARRIEFLSALQSVIVALLMTGVGYLIYGHQFVGTIYDFGSAFFWAFGVDLSVNGLVTAYQGVHRT